MRSRGSPRRVLQRLWAVAALLAVVVTVALTSVATPAQARGLDGEPDDPAAKAAGLEWFAGTVGTDEVKALTASEVIAQGLDQYVNMANYQAVTPTVGDKAGAPDPAKQDTQPGMSASGCWSHWYGSGTSRLYGRTYVTWCGDGHWVRYASSYCTGYSNWWSYRYLGCARWTFYGVGWNVYDVHSRWDLCPWWYPNYCVWEDHPSQAWRYSGWGGIWRLF